MVTREHLVKLINARLTRVLGVVELCVPEGKFPLCRKLILEEFGDHGLGKDLDGLLGSGQGREGHGAGGPIPRKQGGAP
jgi:hypothetical protein